MNTAYKDLSEKEKDSDRELVAPILDAVVNTLFDTAKQMKATTVEYVFDRRIAKTMYIDGKNTDFKNSILDLNKDADYDLVRVIGEDPYKVRVDAVVDTVFQFKKLAEGPIADEFEKHLAWALDNDITYIEYT